MLIMAIRLWSFQTGYIKLLIFLPKNQHTQRMSGKYTHIYFFYFWFKNKRVWAEKIKKSYWLFVQFSKFKNFLSVCWFLGKNLSNIVPPVWKLHNPYCHSMQNNILHILRIRSWIIHTIRCKYVVATFLYASVFVIHAYLAALKKHQHKNEYVHTSVTFYILFVCQELT